MNLIHFDHPNIPPGIRGAFSAKVIAIAAYLGIDPNWLMQVMYAESKMNAAAQNIQGGRLVAAGLLQWTNASGVVGAPQSLLSKNHLQQLDELQRYFTAFRGRMHNYFDVYLVTFFPAAMGKGDSYVFSTSKLSASLIASQNPAINIIRDGMITMAEFRQYVYSSTPVEVRSIVFKAKQVITQAQQQTEQIIESAKHSAEPILNAAGGVAAILAFFFCFAASIIKPANNQTLFYDTYKYHSSGG